MLDFTVVEGIGLRTHLKNNGIDAGSLEAVELGCEIVFVLFCAVSFILRLKHRMQPRSAEFALWRSNNRKCLNKRDYERDIFQ